MVLMKNQRKRRFFAVLIMCIFMFTLGTICSATADEDAAVLTIGATDATIVTVGETEYDLADGDSALEYVGSYADNLEADPDFQTNVNTAIDKVRESIPQYATFWALLAPIIAIVLALITKEVYSSLVIGIIVGGAIYAGGNFEGTLVHVVSDGFIANVADSYNMGILIFLVLLGALVAMMNKAGGSAAFGRWATAHIKSRIGAQLATIALGVLIFIDDYFNCLTVGSVMRPVCDEKKVSRAKLSYLIDATAAPICMIAPISSWAAAVSEYVPEGQDGLSLFIEAIPYNFYSILTFVFIIALTLMKFDYGPMRLHERNALNGDLFTSGGPVIDEDEAEYDEEEINKKSKARVIDLVLPILVLIGICVFALYRIGQSGGLSFADAFGNTDATVALPWGGLVALVITMVYFVARRLVTFKQAMACIPKGFNAMVPAILILTMATSLKNMTGALESSTFVEGALANVGSLQNFLPAIIFLVACFISFATGTSWGTFGILIPIVLAIFPVGSALGTIGMSACLAGSVCGDHCSPISDTTIMSSAGAQCNHINHVSTQLPYALTVAGISFFGYIMAGFINNWMIVLPVFAAVTVAVLFVIKMANKNKD